MEHRPPIDDTLVRRLVGRQFPQWAGRPLRPVDPAGSDHAIFRLGDDLSVRIPRHDGAAGQAAKDFFWLPRLAPHLPLAVPVPVGVGEPDLGYPWQWGVARWLDGEVATVDALGDSAEAATELAGFLRALQTFVPDAEPGPAELPNKPLAAALPNKSLAGLEPHPAALPNKSLADLEPHPAELPNKSLADLEPHPAELPNKSLAGLEPHPAELPNKSLADRDEATRADIAAVAGVFDAAALTEVWTAALDAPAWGRPPVWFHGDFHIGNLLTVDRRLSAVIDFGGLGRGDPACDLTVAFTAMTARTRPIFREALGADDATWARGRGWALASGLNAYVSYAATSPPVAAATTRQITGALAG